MERAKEESEEGGRWRGEVGGEGGDGMQCNQSEGSRLLQEASTARKRRRMEESVSFVVDVSTFATFGMQSEGERELANS
jgi:hypothetical protein